MKNSLEGNNEEFKSVMAPDYEPFEKTFSQELDKIANLPEPQKSPQQEFSNGNRQNSINHLHYLSPRRAK